MVRALVAGLVWLACTGVLSLVIARAVRRADDLRERDARQERETRAARLVVPVAPHTGAGSPCRTDGCALTRPPAHGRTPSSRRRRPRGT